MKIYKIVLGGQEALVGKQWVPWLKEQGIPYEEVDPEDYNLWKNDPNRFKYK